MRKGYVEFRYSKGNKSYELIKWFEGGETCFFIAFFRRKKEGYDMETVGDRFFQDYDAWLVGKHALAFLNEVFESEEDN
jgi:hypothetical protein